MRSQLNITRKRGGQSIVEVIVAIGIVGTAVAAALTLTTASLNAQKENEGWMIATNLAREGVEVARNIRDSNWLAGNAWDDGLYGDSQDYTAIAVFDPETAEWSFDFTGEVLGAANTRVWRYLSGTHIGVYTQGTIQPNDTTGSRFYRLVTLNPICGRDTVVTSGGNCSSGIPKVGIQVRSAVSWQSSGRDRNIEIVETMYDWR